MQNTKENNGSSLESEDVFEMSDRDNAVLYIYKKAEKLAKAIYMVTDLVFPEDPIRNALRDLSVMLLLRLSPKSYTKRFICDTFEIKECISRTISLIEIGRSASLFSEMNSAVLLNEYDIFLHEVAGFQDMPSLKRSFFQAPKAPSLLSGTSQNNLAIKNSFQQTDHTGHLKDKNGEDLHKGHKRQNVKDIVLEGGNLSSQKVLKIGARDPARREIIINMIKKYRTIGIKDISGLISGCSEKTLQRELNALVREGVVRKDGDRRWSRYSLPEGFFGPN